MERAEDGADDQTVMMMELSDQDEDHGPKDLGFQDLGYPGFP